MGILQEDGFYVLQETGEYLLLDTLVGDRLIETSLSEINSVKIIG
jgi:hypothetical protein